MVPGAAAFPIGRSAHAGFAKPKIFQQRLAHRHHAGGLARGPGEACFAGGGWRQRAHRLGQRIHRSALNPVGLHLGATHPGSPVGRIGRLQRKMQAHQASFEKRLMTGLSATDRAQLMALLDRLDTNVSEA